MVKSFARQQKQTRHQDVSGSRASANHGDLAARFVKGDLVHESANQQQSAPAGSLEICGVERIRQVIGIEPTTFRVLGGCDNHYTTETLTSMPKLAANNLCCMEGGF